MIIIEDSTTFPEGFDERNPRIGWHNLVTPGNVTADQEDPEYPAINVANPVTYLVWRGVADDVNTIEVALGSAETVNYVGIAGHNLGSIGATYVVESSANGSDWTPLTDEIDPTDDRVLINEFGDVVAPFFRVVIDAGAASDADTAPEIAVLYIGRILRLQRRIYVGHTPLPFGRRTEVSSQFSESGQFLGRVVRRRMFESAVSMQNIEPTWYRQNMEPFFEASAEVPFFWAWRGAAFPDEVGYAWMAGDPSMSNALSNGMVQFSFDMQGIR